MPFVRKALLPFVVLAAIAAVAVVVLLPPAAAVSSHPEWKYGWPVVKGAFHVHSLRSDGTGTIDEIAAAAARAGLQFVVLTDHGDGTRAPDPASYRSGVLVIDAVEVSTSNGHYVALGLPEMPFRLAGRSRDVIEDVTRAGGFGIAAHPTSRKPDLRWRDWDAAFDGIEWLSADSEWRDEPSTALIRALLTYPVRATEALATLLDRPEESIARWDHAARQRHVIGLAAADAHARLSLGQPGGEYEGGALVRLPSYESSFRVFTNHVVLDAPLTGDAPVDAEQVLRSIRAGRVFSSVEGWAELGAFEVKALSAGMFARAGEYIDSQHPVELEAVIAAPPGTAMVVVRDGAPIYDTVDQRLRIDVGTAPGIYRIEARLPGHPQPQMPWVMTNPIYVNLRAEHGTDKLPAALPVTSRVAVATQSWHAESAPGSESALSPGALADGTPVLQWRLRLGAGQRQFAAIRFPADRGVTTHDRLQLRARADRPIRLWAQLRGSAASAAEQRWGKSFYLGPDVATIDLTLADFHAIDAPTGEPPQLDKVDSLLLVVDTVNTLPGTAATISIADLWLVK